MPHFRNPSVPGGRDPRPVLALAYASTFGHLGVVLPFLAPWIRDRGFGPLVIGVLLALPPLAKMTTPWTWARWADRTGRRREFLVGASLLSVVAMAAMALTDRLIWLALLVAVYGFARAPVLPFIEATSLEQSEQRRFDYGSVRLWGSLAFIACSIGYGALGGSWPEDAVLVSAAALLAVSSVAGAVLPSPWRGLSGSADRRCVGSGGAARGGTAALVRLFAVCALMQTSHGAYYTFYSIRLQDLGYGEAAIGSLWAFAVLCEVALLARMDRIVERFGSPAVLRASLLIAAARWVLIGSTGSAWWLALGQALHAATYAAFHVAAIRIVHRSFSGAERARGQALYSGTTFGLGMFVGSLSAGWLAEGIGLEGVFFVSSAVALAGIPLLGPLRRSLGDGSSVPNGIPS